MKHTGGGAGGGEVEPSRVRGSCADLVALRGVDGPGELENRAGLLGSCLMPVPVVSVLIVVWPGSLVRRFTGLAVDAVDVVANAEVALAAQGNLRAMIG